MTSSRLFLALKWITLVFFLFVFAYKTVTFVDPDLGWHLRAGEIVAQTGHAPMVDPWNYVLTNQEWVDHEWFLDLFLWKAFTIGAWPLVMSLFLVISSIPVLVWIFRARTGVQLLLVAIAASTMWGVIGVRPQVISFLFFFLLYELIFTIKTVRARRIVFFFLPIFFAFWANIHAGFVAGLVLWILVFSARVYEKIRTHELHYDSIINIESISLTASVGATLLSPYHFALWKEIISSTTSPLIAYVAEWQSPFLSVDLPLIILLSGSIVLILSSRKMFSLHQLVPAGFFFISYAQHARMAPFFLITILPLTAKAIDALKDNTRMFLATLSAPRRLFFTLIPSLFLVALLTYNATSDILREPYHPPYKAINILQTIPHESCNIFNDYGMGGWMIFVNPHEKLFIDGRAPHWKGANGMSPFRIYIDLEKYPETMKKVFTKYNICVAILYKSDEPKNSNATKKQDNLPLQNLLTRLVNLFYPESNTVPLAKTLKKADWCEIYTDSEALILVRPKSPLCGQK